MKLWHLVFAGLFVTASSVAVRQIPVVGAGGLLYPSRRPVTAVRPAPCHDATFNGAGVELKGWRCEAAAPRRGTIVYLHGVADNRASGARVVARFASRGFDVLIYDSRAHGESEGDVCT